MPPVYTRADRGFILEQFLIALGILCALLPLFLSQLQLMTKLLIRPVDLQDAIALTQLRHLFNIAENIDIENESLSFDYRGEKRMLRISGKNLILTPGTQYVMTNIEEISFETQENMVLLCWKRKENQTCAALGTLE